MFLQVNTSDAWWGTNRQKRREQAHWEKVRNAQTSYAIQLRKLARHVGELVSHYDPLTPQIIPQIEDLLNRYAWLIRPWAASTATKMIAEVARRDETAWHQHSAEIGRSLRQEVQKTPLGKETKRIQNEQVQLITSIPLQTAQDIQKLVREAYTKGERWETLVDQIHKKASTMTRNRATLIARTETSKVASAIVQARAKHVGSTQYVWHTVRDQYVRQTHRELEGTVQSWDDPPIAEAQGQRHHPGEFPNCRCFAEPIVDHLV